MKKPDIGIGKNMRERKKVLIVASLSSSLRNFRGALIEELICRGIKVYVAAPMLTHDKITRIWLEDRGVVCKNVHMARNGLNPLSDIYYLISLTVLLIRIRPYYFLGYTVKPVIWGTIAAWLVGTPSRSALITGLGYAFTQRKRISRKRRLVKLIVQTLYRFALKRASIVFFQNKDDLLEFRNLGILPPEKNVLIINGSGVDLNAYQFTHIPDGPFRFLQISRLLADKGVREYVAAAKSLRKKWPNVEWHLVGGVDSNPNSISMDEITSWHENGDIIWHGELHDVRPAIEKCHAFVLPSYREGTPRTVLEAMAMGRAIVTTDAPGCRETVLEGENGHLVTVGDDRSLALAMERLIDSPDSLRTMGFASRRIAELKYDVHEVNNSILEGMRIPVCKIT